MSDEVWILAANRTMARALEVDDPRGRVRS